jgi:hypothetical protein
MARFRLTDKHYINIEGCDWEEKQELQSKVRGRARLHKKTFVVPMYLDPKDQSDHNYPGEIIIATAEDRRYPDDYITGPGFMCTADMTPLDDEAEEMMEEWKANYKGEHAIESLTGTMSDDILTKLSRQLDAMNRLQPPVSPITASELDALKSENAELKSQINAILERLGMPTPTAKSNEVPARRI